MADETAPPEEDQPEVNEDAPEEGSASDESPEIDGGEESFTDFDTSNIPEDADREWLAKRYGEMQSAWTQKTQAIAEERKQAENYKLVIEAASNPQHPQHSEALDALGLTQQQAQEIEDDFEDDDDVEVLRREVAAMRDTLSSRDRETQEQAFQRAELQFISDRIEEIETREGRELTDEEADVVHRLAVGNRKHDGEPDVAGAFEALTGIVKQRGANYARSKKAPRSLGNGPAARKQFDIRNDSERMQAAEAAAEAAMQG